MAEIDVSGKGGGKGKPKKLSTRVDLTPMVDLGFLLITFFMFTTTMAKPKTMEIIMPTNDSIEETEKNKVKDYTAMTLLLSKNGRVYYYYGIGSDPLNPPKVEIAYFQPQGGVRDAIIKLKQNIAEFKQLHAGEAGVNAKDEATILIKPDSTSKYEDMINALDEMQINGINTYALIDITEVDRMFIKETEEAGGE